MAMPPGGEIAVMRGLELRLFDVATGKQLRTIGKKIGQGEGGPLALAFAPDGKTIANWGLWSHEGSVDIYDIETGELRTQLKDPNGFVMSFAYAPDGQTAAFSGQDGSIRIVNPSTGEEIRRLSDERAVP